MKKQWRWIRYFDPKVLQEVISKFQNILYVHVKIETKGAASAKGHAEHLRRCSWSCLNRSPSSPRSCEHDYGKLVSSQKTTPCYWFSKRWNSPRGGICASRNIACPVFSTKKHIDTNVSTWAIQSNVCVREFSKRIEFEEFDVTFIVEIKTGFFNNFEKNAWILFIHKYFLHYSTFLRKNTSMFTRSQRFLCYSTFLRTGSMSFAAGRFFRFLIARRAVEHLVVF